MQEYHEFEAWVDQVLDDEDEFGYRYIYDAYEMAQDPQGRGSYCKMETRTNAEGVTEYLLFTWRKECALVLLGDAGRNAFIDYLITRFAPETRNLDAWHNQRSQWHGEDIDGWVDGNGNPIP
jgi:hypothetical protein